MALLKTAKLNGAKLMTWLTYAFARIAEHPVIRMKLLNMGALLRVSVRRIKVARASACPPKDEFAVAHARCRRLIRRGQGYSHHTSSAHAARKDS